MASFIIDRQQAREIDRIATEQYGMSTLVLMENAGRGCADILCEAGIHGVVVICCGKGNNAGDGFVVARHLDLRGHPVRVLLFSPPAGLQGEAETNFAILQKAGIPIEVAPESFDAQWLEAQMSDADWVVDALLGTGIRGEPRPPFDRVIDGLNAVGGRKLAVDVPSGLDCDTGQPAEHTFRADHTCTFVATKKGYSSAAARPLLGEVHVLDIGVPRKLVEQVASRAES